MSLYIGVNNVANNVSGLFRGENDNAKRIIKGFYGINNEAVLIFDSILRIKFTTKLDIFYSSTTTTAVSLYLNISMKAEILNPEVLSSNDTIAIKYYMSVRNDVSSNATIINSTHNLTKSSPNYTHTTSDKTYTYANPTTSNSRLTSSYYELNNNRYLQLSNITTKDSITVNRKETDSIQLV